MSRLTFFRPKLIIPMLVPPHAAPVPTMRPTDQLIAALRAGDPAAVNAALDAGADPNLPDNIGIPGLPLRIAAYNGHLDIIRSLVSRGAEVNLLRSDSRAESLLAVARRGGKKDAVRLLVELGTEIPAGLDIGLTLAEKLAAQGIANRAGREATRLAAGAPPSAPVPRRAAVDSTHTPAAQAANSAATAPPAPAPFAPEVPEWMAKAGAEIEEIDLQGCYGVDTNALNADIMRMANRDAPPEAPKEPEVEAPPLDFGIKRFWKKKE